MIDPSSVINVFHYLDEAQETGLLSMMTRAEVLLELCDECGISPDEARHISQQWLETRMGNSNERES